MPQQDVTLSITFTPDDVDVLERIRDRWGRAVDETGIIEHMLDQYYSKTDQLPPNKQPLSER